MKTSGIAYMFLLILLTCHTGCSGENEQSTPYVYCLDDNPYLFALKREIYYESQEIEYHRSDGTVIPSDSKLNLVFNRYIRFDLNVTVDCYLNENEPLCDPVYADGDNIVVSLEGIFNYNQDIGVKLTELCFSDNLCNEVNIETLTGNGTLHVDGSTDEFWDESVIEFKYSTQCQVGTNPLTGEYISLGQNFNIEVDFPLKNGDSMKCSFNY